MLRSTEAFPGLSDLLIDDWQCCCTRPAGAGLARLKTVRVVLAYCQRFASPRWAEKGPLWGEATALPAAIGLTVQRAGPRD